MSERVRPASGFARHDLSAAARASAWRRAGLSAIRPELIVGLVSFGVLLLTMPLLMNIYDEGIILTDAMLVADGRIVHRDFYSPYGPAQYDVLAALFRGLGRSFLIARCYDLAVRAGVIVMVFAIVRRQGSMALAIIGAGVACVWLATIGSYLYPIFPCLLLALMGGVMIVSRDPGVASWPALLAAGVCTGVVALFRYDVGFFLLVAHLAALAAMGIRVPPRETRMGRCLALGAIYCAGTAAVFVPAALMFLLSSPLAPFVADVIAYPVTYYARMRSLPFPGLTAMIADPASVSVYLPVAAGLLATLEVARARGGEVGLEDRRQACLTVFGLTAVLLFLKGVVRVSPLHMMLGIIPSLIVVLVLADTWFRRGHAARLGAALMVSVLVSPPLFQVMPALRVLRQSRDNSLIGVAWGRVSHGAGPMPCDHAAGSGIAVLSEDDARVANYLAARTRPDERIFVGLDRHDKIFANAVALYFAADRLPGTHWHHFDPGLQTRADIQSDIVADLQRNTVRWVVRDARFDGANEPNGSAESSGVTVLDRYLSETYRPVASAGVLTVWLLNGRTPDRLSSSRGCEAAPLP